MFDVIPCPPQKYGEKNHGENSLVLGKIYEEGLRAAVSGSSPLKNRACGSFTLPRATRIQLRSSGDGLSGPIFSRHYTICFEDTTLFVFKTLHYLFSRHYIICFQHTTLFVFKTLHYLSHYTICRSSGAVCSTHYPQLNTLPSTQHTTLNMFNALPSTTFVDRTALNHICRSDRDWTICCGYPSKELILFTFCHNFLFYPFVKQIYLVWICFCAPTVLYSSCLFWKTGKEETFAKVQGWHSTQLHSGEKKTKNGGELSAQLFVCWKNVLVGSVVKNTGPSVEKEAFVFFPRGEHFMVSPRFFLGAPRICFSFVDCAEIFVYSFFVFFGAPYFFLRNAFLQPLRLPHAHSRLYSIRHRSSTARGHVPPFLWSATLNRPWSTLQ